VSSKGDTALLETVVLGDVVEVVAANNDGALHLGGLDNTLDDTTADGNVRGEGALVVDVSTLNSSLGSLEAQTNVLDEAGLSGLLALDNLELRSEDLLVDGNADLLLEGALVLSMMKGRVGTPWRDTVG